MLLRVFAAFLVVIVSTNAMYQPKDGVVDLTSSNFESRVTDSEDVWIVEFYAPWCGHCQKLVPEYTKVAKALKGVVKVGAVNADEQKQLASRFQIQGFPTIKIFVGKKSYDYSGARTANALIESAFGYLKSKVLKRIGQSSSSSSSGKSSDGSKASKKDVLELTESNFDKEVLKSKQLVLVEFFAPWCGHCKRLEPVWAEVATELKGKVKVAAVDATVHQNLASKYNIKGFPTIKVFSNGNVEDYEGGRTKEDIVNFALQTLADNKPPPEVVQITSESTVKDVCDENQLCVIAFLPHILDCNAKCRNNYVKILKDIADKFKKQQWGYLWAEAVEQPALEDALGIGGFGYPAMAAVNVRKMKYSGLRGSFSFDGINEFLRDLAYGKGSSFPVQGAKIPKITKVDPWDGKDGVPPVEDDHSDL